MRYTITTTEYDEFRSLMESALAAQTKSAANTYISRFSYVASDVYGSARKIISELKSSTIAAAGRIADKEAKAYFCEMVLGKLEQFVEKSE